MIATKRPGPAAFRGKSLQLRAARLAATASRPALLAALAASAALTVPAARAASTSAQLSQLEAQITAIQEQNAAEIASLKAEVAQLQAAQQQQAVVVARTQQQQAVVTKQVASVASAPHMMESPTHQFGFVGANGANTISILARVQLDAGDYLHVTPQGGYLKGGGPGSLAGGPLDSGVNARRARLGIGGTFQNDWAYRFIYDFGGSSDSETTGVPGAGTSGVENAYITYNGFYRPKYPVPVAIDLGYLDVPWTMEEATSSNDIMFMERSSSQVVATEFGGGDFRSAFGVRSNNSRYWFGAYLTGPQSGAQHTGATDPTSAADIRASYQVIQMDNATLHLGVDYNHLFQARAPYNSGTTGPKTNSSYLVLSDRPELRVDPTNILNTGGIPTRNASVLSGEAAGSLGPFYVQGEYFYYSVKQFKGTNPTDGLTDVVDPTLHFHGGYVEGSYAIGGTRQYIASTGAYSGVIPEHPFDLHGGGFGAWEFAGRYGRINLNDDIEYKVDPHLTGGVDGGDQQSYEIGINWYPNVNMKFMLDYNHVDVNKLKADTTGTYPTTFGGATVDAIAARAQFVY